MKVDALAAMTADEWAAGSVVSWVDEWAEQSVDNSVDKTVVEMAVQTETIQVERTVDWRVVGMVDALAGAMVAMTADELVG